ncbi:MAG: hypothetical protein MET45_13915 [Nostoc sp. LLA-1]|nr:hypothetical protein [Cyanocohniella sp. LLY]
MTQDVTVIWRWAKELEQSVGFLVAFSWKHPQESDYQKFLFERITSDYKRLKQAFENTGDSHQDR